MMNYGHRNVTKIKLLQKALSLASWWCNNAEGTNRFWKNKFSKLWLCGMNYIRQWTVMTALQSFGLGPCPSVKKY